MKNFIITLLSGLALSLSAFVFAGGAVVEAPTAEENPAAQVAPVEGGEVADTDATECDAEKADCEKEETADATDATDSPVQTAPVEDSAAS
ncbi:MAG: hypothetical protein ACPGSM_04140 [Thiolinea sp.]